MYHEVANTSDIDALARKTQRSYITPRTVFEQQIEYLTANDYTAISLDALLAWQAQARDLPPRPIVITFDDGFRGNYEHAFPILRRHGFRATFFVVSNKIGDPSMMSWAQLREMRAADMAVESHTANHPLLSTLDERHTRDELSTSKLAIEDRVGHAVRFLSLPNGDSNRYYPSVARACGYQGGCCSRFGFNRRSTAPYFWRRIAIKHGMSLATFGAMVSRQQPAIARMAVIAAAKAAIPAVLGKRNYDRVYNFVFGVEEQDKSKAP